MSMMGTLAKVAIGVAIAKGASMVMDSASQSQAAGSNPQGGTGSTGGGTSGGVGDMLGSMLGGGGTSGSIGNQLGGMFSQLTEGAGGAASGLGNVLNQFTGGSTGSGGSGGGGLGGMLAGLAGGAAAGAGASAFGNMLNSALKNNGEPEEAPSQDHEDAAEIMLRAMIQAAKSDGTIDDDERQKIDQFMSGLNDEDKQFVQKELDAPVDVQGLANDVPHGMEQPVYTMSLMGINLDQASEANYLRELAAALKIPESEVNAIHDKLGVQRIYTS